MKMISTILISSALVLLALAQEPLHSILDIAKNTSEHTMLVAALYKADMVKTLSKNQPITLFAPDDEAFRNLEKDSSEILDDTNLGNLLQHHIVAGKWTLAQIIEAIDLGGGVAEIKTLDGDTLKLTVVDGNIILNDSVAFVTPDLEAEDGILHSIDGVLLSK
jgi:uncharacterized surface protein with fasciclin (FAS1) repeats